MTCTVRHCSRPRETLIDLDPDKPGGPYSFPMEMPVCRHHYDQLRNPATEWACGPFSGNDREVVVGADLGELDEWALTPAISVRTDGQRRHSTNLPRRNAITLNLRKVGTGEARAVEFGATREEIDHLIDFLQKHSSRRKIDPS